MNNKRVMTQCVCCGTVFTKDGFPNKSFNYDDKHIFGCTMCKLGDWSKHSKTTLVRQKVSIVRDLEENEVDDTGYLDYNREENCEIEGISLENLLTSPRPLKPKLESVENIS